MQQREAIRMRFKLVGCAVPMPGLVRFEFQALMDRDTLRLMSEVGNSFSVLMMADEHSHLEAAAPEPAGG